MSPSPNCNISLLYMNMRERREPEPEAATGENGYRQDFFFFNRLSFSLFFSPFRLSTPTLLFVVLLHHFQQ